MDTATPVGQAPAPQHEVHPLWRRLWGRDTAVLPLPGQEKPVAAGPPPHLTSGPLPGHRAVEDA